MDTLTLLASNKNTAGFERAVIGTALKAPFSMDDADILFPQDFAFSSHQKLWRIILGHYGSESLSLTAVVEDLRASGELETIGLDFGSKVGTDYIDECLEKAAPQSMKHFAKQVLDGAIRRQVYIDAAIIMAAADSERPASEILDDAEQRILNVRARTRREGSDIGTIMDAFITKTEKRMAGEPTNDFPIFIKELHDVVDFFEEEDFPIVAGRPGEGKSSFLRLLAFRAALAGRPVGIFNLENSELEYARQLIAMDTGINTAKLRSGSLSTEDMQRTKDAIGRLRNMPLNIVTLGAPSVHEILRIARKMVSSGTKSIFVDYIQLITNGASNQVEDISMSSSALRGFALQNKVPTFAAAQLNREIVHRGENADPSLADLRGSGSLEQDATQVITLRFGWNNPTDREIAMFPENVRTDGTLVNKIRAVPIIAHVIKNRNGPTGPTLPMKWDKATNRFTSIRANNL